MNLISGFLQKFLSLERDNQKRISLVLESIKEVTALDLKKEDIEISGDFLKLKTNPVIRNEIFLYKEKIENLLRSNKIFLKIL